MSGTAADSRLTLVEALAAYWLPDRDTLPRDSIYPPGQSADEVERAETQMMDSSQSDAVVAALRAAGQPVTEMPVVASVTVGGPAHQKLLPGDLVQSVDGVRTADQRLGARADPHPSVPARWSGSRSCGTRSARPVSVTDSRCRHASPAPPWSGSPSSTATTTRRPSVSTSGSSWAVPAPAWSSRWPSTTRSPPATCFGELHVAGTGQISADGKVGAIGGLQQKIASADEAGATVFLVPEVNCRDLAGLDTDLKLVKVATLGEAIDAVGAVAQSGPSAETPSCR